MFWDIFELWTQNTNIFFKRLNELKIMKKKKMDIIFLIEK